MVFQPFQIFELVSRIVKMFMVFVTIWFQKTLWRWISKYLFSHLIENSDIGDDDMLVTLWWRKIKDIGDRIIMLARLFNLSVIF